MKIWIKITLLVILVSAAILHVTLINVRNKMETQILTLNGERLKTLAVSTASLIDGDTYKTIDFNKTYRLDKDPNYLNVSKLIKKIQSGLGDKEEIFTLSRVDENEAVFGVMSDKLLCVGDTLHLISMNNKNALDLVYSRKRAQYTDIYSDQYGTWLSGLAPIMDSENNVVGAVQVDFESTLIYEQINEINEYINYMRLIFLPFIIFLSVILSRVITKPINKVIRVINNISNGDYREPVPIKAYGEVKNLVVSTETMRRTILEQQTKIFDTIDELKQSNLKLENAKTQIEALDKLKSEFLALVSHEVRTPINVIKGNLDIIKTENVDLNPDEINYFFDTIDLEFKRLIRTIDMVVMLAELQSDTYQKKDENIDLRKIIEAVFKEYKEKAELKMIGLKFNMTPGEYIIRGDQYSVEQIITNIVDNAVKFTHQGEVEITLTNKKENETNFEVADTGIGISKEFIPNLFKPFLQEDSSYSRQYEGNGLGLALIKKCIELNEAFIYVASEKGKGTRFAITFDLNKVKESEPQLNYEETQLSIR